MYSAIAHTHTQFPCGTTREMLRKDFQQTHFVRKLWLGRWPLSIKSYLRITYSVLYSIRYIYAPLPWMSRAIGLYTIQHTQAVLSTEGIVHSLRKELRPNKYLLPFRERLQNVRFQNNNHKRFKRTTTTKVVGWVMKIDDGKRIFCKFWFPCFAFCEFIATDFVEANHVWFCNEWGREREGEHCT